MIVFTMDYLAFIKFVHYEDGKSRGPPVTRDRVDQLG
jgi:hypothetical protein